MRVLSLFALLSLLTTSLAEGSQPHARSYNTHTYYTLELGSSSPDFATAIATSVGAELVEQVGELQNHWLIRTPGSTPHHGESSLQSRSESDDPVIRKWKELRSILPRDHAKRHLRSLTPLKLRQRNKRLSPHSSFPRALHPLTGLPIRQDSTEQSYAVDDLGIADPMFNQQWHLVNTEMTDIELNVTGVWGRGVIGKGVRAAIIDDGLDANSNDLKDNFYAEGSWDFNDHTNLPLPRLSDDQHGTRCAGEIAAVKNDVCGVGVAYGAQVAGVRILSAPISDADEAAALNYHYQENDIYSCSWGPPDDGKSMEAPESVILKAMVNGVQNGRDGKGSIFVFAAGNGGGVDDQCNFDGYTNSIFSITVGAIDRKGLHPYYSELCAGMMLVAPSSGSGDHIHTTDVGENKCSHNHGGTSAAAPLAAGVFALALQVRPELSWRDMQHIALRTSIHMNPDDPDWSTTAVGRPYSYKYGYGRIDAGRIVELAETWPLVKPQAWFDSPAVHLPDDKDVDARQVAEGQDEPQANPTPIVKPSGTTITSAGIQSVFEVTQDMLDDSNFETLEHVTVRLWVEHQRRGDVEVQLTSPNGIKSVLAVKRRFDEDSNGFDGWKFMSLKHWEENPVGPWTLTVYDKINPDKVGRFVAWSLQLWGECKDASLAKVWAPAEEGEPDEEQIGSDPTATLSQKPKPTQHLPGDHGEASGEADQPGLDPTQSGTNEDVDIAEPTAPSDEVAGNYWQGIQSLAENRIWLGGSAIILLFFGAGIGTFFFIRARRKRRNLFGLANNGEGGARGAYAPVDEEVPMGLLERGRRKFGRGGGGGGGIVGSKDLYDAFGDGPSDESDLDDDEGRGLDERTALRYHDDFLEDDPRSGDADPPEYRDEPEPSGTSGEKKDEGSTGGATSGGGRRGGEGESNSGSSSSWQDAAEDVGGSGT